MVTITPAIEDTLVFEGLIALLVLRRTILIARGTRYSETRVVVSALFYVLLTGSVLLEDAFLFPTYVIGIDVAVLVVVMVLTLPHTRQHVQFIPGPTGWTYKLPMFIGLVYVSLFVVRTAITLIFAPQLVEAEFGETTGISSLSGNAYIAVAVVDLLLSGSTGLYFGRSAGVVLAYRSLPSSPPLPSPAEAPPLPSGGSGSSSAPPQRL